MSDRDYALWYEFNESSQSTAVRSGWGSITRQGAGEENLQLSVNRAGGEIVARLIRAKGQRNPSCSQRNSVTQWRS